MALWVDIAGYKGMYQIIDEGDVKSFHARDKNGRILKPGKRGRGNCKYAFVVLTDGKSNVLNGWAHTAGGYVWKYEKRKVE